MEFKRPFAAMRRDPHAVRKVLIGALVSVIPYVGIFAFIGWGLDYMRRVAWGEDERLPEWKPFEPIMWRGLYAFVGIMPLSLALSVVVVPLAMVAAGAIVALPLMGQASLCSIVGALALVMAGTLALTYAIVPLTYSIYAQVALYERLEAAFQYRDMWARLKRSGPAARRALWYTIVLGVAVTLPMLAIFVVPAVAGQWMLAEAGSADATQVRWALAAFGFSAIAYGALMLVSTITSIAMFHYWGMWAREAYGLPVEGVPVPEPAIEPTALG